MDKLLVKKALKCPICSKEVEYTAVRDVLIKVIATDSDLRPYYQGPDAVKYEVVACAGCGYASLVKTFNKVSTAKTEDIVKRLKLVYRNNLFVADEYSYEMAVHRYILALQIREEKEMTESEIFYLYFKLSWLFRVMNIKNSVKYEYNSCKEALKHGRIAFEKDISPFINIDDDKMKYILSDLCRRQGNYDEALKYLSLLMQNLDINKRLREKGEDLKELIIVGKNKFKEKKAVGE
ncbi:MAG: DUF2225 domain-containing protein [Lachnospirales bacterium]